MTFTNSRTTRNKQQGTIIVLAGLSLALLAGAAALALDSSLLFVARNELQNAADAGALAGARDLYLEDGVAVNPDANQTAFDIARSNMSQSAAVEVNWTGGNAGDVQRGHWSFATRTFSPNASLAAVDLFNATTAELDADPDFINAVRVTTRRQATPVQSILAGVFGIQSTTMEASAVAYIGFAGTLQPTEADQPIAICEDRLRNTDGEYSCNVGTFIPSSEQTMSETGGWTSFTQENACQGGTNASDLRPLICSTGNGESLQLGQDMATQGGQVQSAFDDLYDCWEAATNKTAPWNLTLPVISCPDPNVGPCNELRGAVNLNVIFMLSQANDIDSQAPTEMSCPDYMTGSGGPCTIACGEDGEDSCVVDWSNDSADGIERWNDFVDFFNIDKPDGTPAHYEPPSSEIASGWRQKTIYFLPDCSVHAPSGRTGGENFGVLAKVPVLVQ